MIPGITKSNAHKVIKIDVKSANKMIPPMNKPENPRKASLNGSICVLVPRKRSKYVQEIPLMNNALMIEEMIPPPLLAQPLVLFAAISWTAVGSL